MSSSPPFSAAIDELLDKCDAKTNHAMIDPFLPSKFGRARLLTSPQYFPDDRIEGSLGLVRSSPSLAWTARPCGASASLEFDVWLALVLTFSPREKEQASDASGFADAHPETPSAGISRRG